VGYKEISDNVFQDERGNIYTYSNQKNSVYGERLIRYKMGFLRQWNPFRSKLSAALHRKLKVLNLRKDSVVLYLGSASGTTVSHVSDIVENGIVFAIDISPKEMTTILFRLAKRMNVAPILADCRCPARYEKYFTSMQADCIIQDIACRDQVPILLRNADAFLKKGGDVYVSLKVKSITQSKNSTEVLTSAKQELQQHFRLEKSVNLHGYEETHWLLHLKKL